MKRYRFFSICIVVLLMLQGCMESTKVKDSNKVNIDDFAINVKPTKWFKNHTAALTLTYDDGWPIDPTELEVYDYLYSKNMGMDLELCSDITNDRIVSYMNSTFRKKDKQDIFGHGHRHINHDALTYEQNLEDFGLNYNYIVEHLNMTPISYAYPGGYGYKESTYKALKDVGFYSSRMHHTQFHKNPYIAADTIVAPENFFQLPCLVMQSIEAQNNAHCINNTEELIPYLDNTIEKKAWLIQAYHGIGDPNNSGFYELDEFYKGVDEMVSRDFWFDSMNNITLYLYQKKYGSLKVDDSQRFDGILKYTFEHDLDPSLFNHKMTFAIELPILFVDKVHLTVKADEISYDAVITDNEIEIDLEPNKEYTFEFSYLN